MKKIIYKSIYWATIGACVFLVVLMTLQSFVWIRNWFNHLIDVI